MPPGHTGKWLVDTERELAQAKGTSVEGLTWRKSMSMNDVDVTAMVCNYTLLQGQRQESSWGDAWLACDNGMFLPMAVKGATVIWLEPEQPGASPTLSSDETASTIASPDGRCGRAPRPTEAVEGRWRCFTCFLPPQGDRGPETAALKGSDLGLAEERLAAKREEAEEADGEEEEEAQANAGTSDDSDAGQEAPQQGADHCAAAGGNEPAG